MISKSKVENNFFIKRNHVSKKKGVHNSHSKAKTYALGTIINERHDSAIFQLKNLKN